MADGGGAAFIELVGVGGQNLGARARLEDIAPRSPLVGLAAGGNLTVAALGRTSYLGIAAPIRS